MTKLTPCIFKNIKNRLNDMRHINNKKVTNNTSLFGNISIPNTSIGNYIKRIRKYFECSDHVIVLALIYIDRYIEYNKLLIQDQNIHRLIITACIISAKFLEDEHHTNKFYSHVGGFSLTEINLLEREMLQGLDYNLYVNKIEYYQRLTELKNNNLSSQITQDVLLKNDTIQTTEDELLKNDTI